MKYVGYCGISNGLSFLQSKAMLSFVLVETEAQ